MDFSQFVSNLFSTIIGAGAALVGAIWLDRRANARIAKSHESERRERAKRVLSLIKDELSCNLATLKTTDRMVEITFAQLRTENWQVFSDGGELKSIDNPVLLGAISTAYANINQYQYLYKKYFEMNFFPANNVYTSLKEVFHGHTMQLHSKSIVAITEAIESIKKSEAN